MYYGVWSARFKQKQKRTSAPRGIRTHDTRFKVWGANHYTMGAFPPPWITQWIDTTKLSRFGSCENHWILNDSVNLQQVLLLRTSSFLERTSGGTGCRSYSETKCCKVCTATLTSFHHLSSLIVTFCAKMMLQVVVCLSAMLSASAFISGSASRASKTVVMMADKSKSLPFLPQPPNIVGMAGDVGKCHFIIVFSSCVYPLFISLSCPDSNVRVRWFSALIHAVNLSYFSSFHRTSPPLLVIILTSFRIRSSRLL